MDARQSTAETLSLRKSWSYEECSENKIIYLGNRFNSDYSPSTVELTAESMIYISLGTVFNKKIDLFTLLPLFRTDQEKRKFSLQQIAPIAVLPDETKLD